MYAEAELLFPYFQNPSQEVQQLEEFCRSQKLDVPMGNLVQTSTISDYDLGGEGDLFKAPEPIAEEPVVELDPMKVAISMISCGEDVIPPEGLGVGDIESIQSEQLLSEIFYGYEKDLLAKDAIQTPFYDVLDIKIPVVRTDDNLVAEGKLLTELPVQKCVSSESLSSMDLLHRAPNGPNFLEFSGMNFSVVYGMRRAFSEGDMKTLGNADVSLIHSPHGQPQIINNSTTEDRRQKLSRYRNKKTKRDFGRKIKYACRKALADSQPRIRGRFAKTEESDISRKH